MKTAQPNASLGAKHQAEITEQYRMPLVEQLLTEARRSTAAFHTPGHHGRVIDAQLQVAWGEAVFAADLPELPGLDNLFAPESVIAEAQILAAKTFGAERTFFLTNGSTAGVMAAILATCAPGDRILLPRTVHRSVISGLIFSGAQPVFVTPEVCPRTGLVGTISPATIVQAFAEYPDLKAVMVVSPTYEGVCADLEAIARCCHEHQVPLLVDEAHGPHFGFHPELPASALSQGADLAVQSTHKVLSGLTQSAMLHLGHGSRGCRSRGCCSKVDGDRVAQALQLVQSTSPNYLLLASLDAARRQMATQGHELMAETLKLVRDARDRLSAIDGLNVFELTHPHLPGFKALDPTRLTLDLREWGQTGFDLDEQLNETHGVVAELPSLHHLTFIISLGNRQEDIDRLVEALADIASRREEASKSGDETSESEAINTSLPLPLGTTAPVISPRDAHFAGAEAVDQEAAVGRISAETVCPYPPGIPILLPGERISGEAIAYLNRVKATGGMISGATDPSLETLRVVVGYP